MREVEKQEKHELAAQSSIGYITLGYVTFTLQLPGGVSLDEPSNEFSWDLIFTGEASFTQAVKNFAFVSEIRWRLRIDDVETPLNFQHTLYQRSFITIGYTPSAKILPHESSFGELARCSETQHVNTRLPCKH